MSVISHKVHAMVKKILTLSINIPPRSFFVGKTTKCPKINQQYIFRRQTLSSEGPKNPTEGTEFWGIGESGWHQLWGIYNRWQQFWGRNTWRHQCRARSGRLKIHCFFLLIMIICYQNCSDLLWEKIVLVIEKNFFNLRLKVKKFAKFLRSLEQFIQKVKGRNNFW